MALVWLVGMSASPLHAQVVRGRVVDQGTAAPVAGAHVMLVDSTGQARMSTLSNDQGTFSLQVVNPGSYRLRVEMIGRRSVESDTRTITTDVSGIELALPLEPVVIAGIDVRASQKCEMRPGAGQATQRVWDEVRKALAVEASIRGQRLYRFDMTSYERELDESGRRVVSEKPRFVSRFSGDPFVSRPVEELVERGWVQEEGDKYVLYGPNAEVLLSDLFMDTHCFYLRRDSDHDGEIGLSFEPTPERRLPDVEGTLWLNEATAELRSLDFSYTRMPSALPPGPRGGEVRFQRLPNGAFIIRSWEIRSQIFGRVESTFEGRRVSSDRVTGHYVSGGEVLNIIDRSGHAVDASPRAVLAGIVFDSTTNAPLASAEVVLQGTSYAGRTDGEGRFRISNLPPGTYGVTFRHELTVSWHWTPDPVEVQLVRGAVTEIVLATPAAGPPLTIDADAARRDSIAAAGAILGQTEWAESRARAGATLDTTGAPGRMRGSVVDERTGRAVAGARVTLDDETLITVSDDNGRFRFDRIRPGVHELIVERIGYVRNVTRFALRPGQFLDAQVRLGTRPVELDSLAVTVRSERLIDVGFYERRESGLGGHFIPRDQIERRNTPFVTDVLGDVPGVKVLYVGPGRRTVRFNRHVTFGSTGSALDSRGCEPDVYLDDALYRDPNPNLESSGGTVHWASPLSKVDNFDALPIAQVEAIEVYVGAATPIKYNNPCGVVLLWTRRGEPS